MLLLAERPESIERQLNISANSSPAHSAQSDWCELIGPFIAEQHLEETQVKLASAGFESKPLHRSRPPNARFWAYIGAQDDRNSMLAKLAMLRKNNIDGHLLQHGERIYTISLKYFANRAEAAEFIDRVAQLDVSAEVIDLNEETEKLWLKIPRKTDSFLPGWINDEYPGKKTLKDNCDKVANSAKFH